MQEEGGGRSEEERFSLGCEIVGCLHWLLPTSPVVLPFLNRRGITMLGAWLSSGEHGHRTGQ